VRFPLQSRATLHLRWSVHWWIVPLPPSISSLFASTHLPVWALGLRPVRLFTPILRRQGEEKGNN
jgi:hypothetical protein